MMAGGMDEQYAVLGKHVAAHADRLNSSVMNRNGWEIGQLAMELNRFAETVLAEVALMPGRVTPIVIPLKGTDAAEDKLMRILRAVHKALYPGTDPGDDRVCIECGLNHPSAIVSMTRK
jgi:hypothetical protein